MDSPSRKHVLITGLSGFTGQHLAANLASKDYFVSGLEADLRDREAVFNEVGFKNPDYVIHLAAISFAAELDSEKIYNVNVVGTVNLLEALVGLSSPPKRVILASSATVYGNQVASVLVESMCPAPVNHYGCSKLAMEHLSRTYAGKLDIIVTRPFNYTGVGHSENFLIPKIVSAYRFGSKEIELGNLHVSREFNDVRDVCEIYEKLLSVNKASDCLVVNICSGRAIKLFDVIEIMNGIAGYEIDVKVNPAFVRGSEIAVLEGSAGYLNSFVNYKVRYSVRDTLHWMFES